MTRGKLLNFLTEIAKEYRLEILPRLNDSAHMHNLSEKDLKMLEKEPLRAQRIIDALLVSFINKVGVSQGVDYGLYTKDLK